MLNEEVIEWLKFANVDLDSAKHLLKMKPQPNEIICYHCQQAVEKFLKSYIIYCNEEIEKIHNLLVLNSTCKKYDQTFETIEEKCSKLNGYGTMVRYPFHTIDLEKIDVNEAVKYAGEIKEFIETKLGEPNEETSEAIKGESKEDKHEHIKKTFK